MNFGSSQLSLEKSSSHISFPEHFENQPAITVEQIRVDGLWTILKS
jgi:hypothetical protein